MKQTIKLKESQLKKLVNETFKKVIKEREDIGNNAIQPKNYVPNDLERMKHYKYELRNNLMFMMGNFKFTITSGWMEGDKEEYIKILGEEKFYEIFEELKQAEKLCREAKWLLYKVYEKTKEQAGLV
jgi:hypothetical protein